MKALFLSTATIAALCSGALPPAGAASMLFALGLGAIAAADYGRRPRALLAPTPAAAPRREPLGLAA